jgi:hypothetical protein
VEVDKSGNSEEEKLVHAQLQATSIFLDQQIVIQMSANTSLWV